MKKSKLVNKTQLLEELFEQDSRPSVRWLNYQIADGKIPYLKIGGMVFFDMDDVREAIAKPK